MGRVVGVVAELWRYPVKSMAGERVPSAELRWLGLRGDREYGFVFADRLNRFPWLSARDVSDLVRYQPYSGDYGATGLEVEVQAPDGRRTSVADPRLAGELSASAGADVRLLQIARGAYDAMPVSLVSTATFGAIDAAHGSSVDPRRFRINIVIQSSERDEEWQGVVEIGRDGPRLAVTHGIPRCVLTTIDPETGRRDPSIMRTVVQAFGNEVGQYCSVLRPGFIKVGDEVRLFAVDTSLQPGMPLEAAV